MPSPTPGSRPVPEPPLPTGTVTFLYIDLEGSTRQREQHPAAMHTAVDRHLVLLRAAIRAQAGHVFRTVGDGLCAAFARAPDALAAAVAAQRALQAEPRGEAGPLRARMALHTGAAEVQDGDYAGACLNRLGRLLAATHGGQVVLSQATADLVQDALPEGVTLRDLGAHRLRDLARVLPLIRRVLAQTERRELRGEPVPAREKVVSLFEPHTAILPRHKPGRRVEFGRKLWVAEVEGGLVTDARVLAGAPRDGPCVPGSLARHQRQFGRAPDLLTGDRGCSSPDARRAATAAGVRRVALPLAGRPPPGGRARERERWFRRGYRWRAGIEGRLAVLRRGYGLARCPDHGDAGLQRWVGWGVLTHDLVVIARALASR
jgi:class 3 adenylate cyclase